MEKMKLNTLGLLLFAFFFAFVAFATSQANEDGKVVDVNQDARLFLLIEDLERYIVAYDNVISTRVSPFHYSLYPDIEIVNLEYEAFYTNLESLAGTTFLRVHNNITGTDFLLYNADAYWKAYYLNNTLVASPKYASLDDTGSASPQGEAVSLYVNQVLYTCTTNAKTKFGSGDGVTTILGRYEIDGTDTFGAEETLATFVVTHAKGFGCVKLAYDVVTEKVYALKVAGIGDAADHTVFTLTESPATQSTYTRTAGGFSEQYPGQVDFYAHDNFLCIIGVTKETGSKASAYIDVFQTSNNEPVAKHKFDIESQNGDAVLASTFDRDNQIFFIGNNKGKIFAVKFTGTSLNVTYTLSVSFKLSSLHFDYVHQRLIGYGQVASKSGKLVKIYPGNCASSDCGGCVAAADNPYCEWCFLEESCLISDKCSQPGLVFSPTKGSCPEVTSTTSELFVDYSTNIIVESSGFVDASSFDPPLQYSCVFTNDDDFEKVTVATLEDPATLSCALPDFEMTTVYDEFTLQIKLNGNDFGGSHQLDVYDCRVAQSCISCNNVPQCKFCGSSSTCIGEVETCDNVFEPCPNAEITSISQNIDFLSGGSSVTISGKYFSDTLESCSLAGVPCNCDPVDEDASAVICVAGPSPDAKTGPVALTFDSVPADNDQDLQFQYLDEPTIDSISSSIGIESGGLPLTIEGKNIGAFDSKVYLGEILLCETTKVNLGKISCTTNSAPVGANTITIEVHTAMISSTLNYTVVEDPSVSSVEPLSSPISGGIQLEIVGTGFTIAPILVFLDSDTRKRAATNCEIDPSFNSTHLYCVTGKASGANAGSKLKIQMGGAVVSFGSNFNYVNDPVISNVIPAKATVGSSISVTGTYFSSGVPTIKIGKCDCKLGKSNTDTTIACTIQSCSLGEYDLTLKIGNAVVTAPNKFEIIAESSAEFKLPINIIAPVVAVVGLILILLLIAIFIMYRRRRSSMEIKERQPVKDVAQILYGHLKDCNAEASEKTFQQLEMHLEAILLTDQMDIYELFNGLPNSDNIMKAIGLFLHEKGYLINVFEYFAAKEVVTGEDPQRLFRGPDVCSRFYRSVLKNITFHYYWNLVGPIIDLVIQHPDTVAAHQKLSRANSQKEMMSDEDIELFELNVYKTQLVSHQLITNVLKSVPDMPSKLRELLYAIGKQIADKYDVKARNNGLTTFVILRFISSILMTPEQYKILESDNEPVEIVKNTLSNLSSILIKAASASEFREADGKLAELNPFIRTNFPKFEKFFDQLMDTNNMGGTPSALEKLPRNVKNLVVTEICNALIQNKDKFMNSLTSNEMKTKLHDFYEAITKPPVLSKNYDAKQL